MVFIFPLIFPPHHTHILINEEERRDAIFVGLVESLKVTIYGLASGAQVNHQESQVALSRYDEGEKMRATLFSLWVNGNNGGWGEMDHGCW